MTFEMQIRKLEQDSIMQVTVGMSLTGSRSNLKTLKEIKIALIIGKRNLNKSGYYD